MEKQPSGINIEWNGKASLSRRHRRRTVELLVPIPFRFLNLILNWDSTFHPAPGVSKEAKSHEKFEYV